MYRHFDDSNVGTTAWGKVPLLTLFFASAARMRAYGGRPALKTTCRSIFHLWYNLYLWYNTVHGLYLYQVQCKKENVK